jgi:hypothetical protein
MAYLYPLVVGPLRVFGLLIHQRRGDRAVGSGDFCLSPVIVCLCNIFMQIFYVFLYISVCI